MEPSYASGTSSTPLLGDTIGDNLDRTIARFGDREALVSVHQDLRYTYAQFGEAVERAARAFIAAGIEAGDRVGIWSPNCAEWALVQYATAKTGIILVNINPAYRTSELEFVLRQSGCRMLVAATAFKTSDYVAMVDAVRDNLDGLEQVVFLGHDWERFLARGEGVSADEVSQRQAATQFDDPINIQYTSGTTGFPKGATLSHHNILNNGFFVGQGCRYSEADRVCIPVPYYHCFGMVMGNLACTSHGACMVIPAGAFDPVATLQAVQDEQCTSLYGVPTMFIAELEHPEFGEFELTSLRTGIMAGSPCPIETMRRVVSEMHMEEVTICYGMTETSPVSTQTGADDPLDKRVGTVGRVHPHVEVKIVDPESHHVVARGEPGELCTRAYSVMLGYWDEPEKTAGAIDRARWMHTGDLAQMDDEGYVKIVGRIKDMVIRGGENVYPREIEEFLMGHPDVAAVSEFCRGKIAHYKVPRYVQVVSEFPMTVTGKVQKYKLREQAIEELGLAEVETA
jgi:fatty-acyl-CoA synthase